MPKRFVIVLAALLTLASAGCYVSPLSQGESGRDVGGAVDVLAGTWNLPCTADTAGSYYTVSWVFLQGEFTRTERVYSVSDCSTVPSYALSDRGVYEMGGPFFTPSGYYCVEVDLGYALLGPRYDIFRATGGVLYFGDPSTGSTLTASERPTEIDFGLGYEKQ